MLFAGGCALLGLPTGRPRRQGTRAHTRPGRLGPHHDPPRGRGHFASGGYPLAPGCSPGPGGHRESEKHLAGRCLNPGAWHCDPGGVSCLSLFPHEQHEHNTLLTAQGARGLAQVHKRGHVELRFELALLPLKPPSQLQPLAGCPLSGSRCLEPAGM